VSVEEVKEDGSEAPKLAFQHISSEIGALEAEEVGVEHLLRDVKVFTNRNHSNIDILSGYLY
jgi:26S proteasome regulatory subunit N8